MLCIFLLGQSKLTRPETAAQCSYIFYGNEVSCLWPWITSPSKPMPEGLLKGWDTFIRYTANSSLLLSPWTVAPYPLVNVHKKLSCNSDNINRHVYHLNSL